MRLLKNIFQAGNGLACLVVALGCSGCVSKSKARLQAQAAFSAGQAQAFAQMRSGNIRVVGPVRNPEIPWRTDLTLAQVIAEADVAFKHDPRAIFILRQGDRLPVDLNLLLKGEDTVLQRGDMVEIQR